MLEGAELVVELACIILPLNPLDLGHIIRNMIESFFNWFAALWNGLPRYVFNGSLSDFKS